MSLLRLLLMSKIKWSRPWPDKPPGAIYCTFGLPKESLVGLPRLALGKPRVQYMAPGGLSDLVPYFYSKKRISDFVYSIFLRKPDLISRFNPVFRIPTPSYYFLPNGCDCGDGGALVPGGDGAEEADGEDGEKDQRGPGEDGRQVEAEGRR